jgi:peptide/nickel transport system ATP-binding protein
MTASGEPSVSEQAQTPAATDGGTARPDGDVLLQVTNLVRHFPVTRGVVVRQKVGAVRAVDGIDMTVTRGQTLGLVGESGCGKSTLARGLLGLLPEGAVTAGTVEFGDRNLIGMPQAELRWLRGPSLGMIFQEPMTRLDPLMRISDHFAEALKTHEPQLTDSEVRQRSLEVLGSMGIPPTRFGHYPYEFSGGMRQRILIALALVLQPKFVVADEPTTALDVLVEAQILEILADIKRNFDTAILFITHNLGIVAETCDRIAVMYAGRIVEQGLVSEVFASPQHPYTRELLASTISLSTTGLHYIDGAPPDLSDPPAGCRFHPRCPQVMPVCREQFPVPIELGRGHPVECWLHAPGGSDAA